MTSGVAGLKPSTVMQTARRCASRSLAWSSRMAIPVGIAEDRDATVPDAHFRDRTGVGKHYYYDGGCDFDFTHELVCARLGRVTR